MKTALRTLGRGVTLLLIVALIYGLAAGPVLAQPFNPPSGTLLGAPRSRRNFTISSRPNFAAQASGVDCRCSSRASRSAPASSSFRASATSPLRAA